MSQEVNFRINNSDHEYVDIHGRDISSVIVTGETTFPLAELRQTGVRIYQKTQYAKLLTTDKQFDEEFNLFMLESAKNFMLENKIAFSEEQIVRTINNCKRLLTEKKQTQQRPLFTNRVVAERSDNDIQIQVKVPQVSTVSSATSTPTCSRKSIVTKLTKKSPREFLLKDSERLNVCLEKRIEQTGVEIKENQFNEKIKTPVQRLRLPLPNVGTLDKKKEHDVIVTCIHKRNCIWVRLKSCEEIFENIHRLVNMEAKHQKPAQKPWKLEKVYMTSDEGSWFRCKIIRLTPLMAFFLDYGNVAEVEDILDVSDELANIQRMAVRLTFNESEYDPRLEDQIKIRIIKQNDDGTYFVNVLGQTTLYGGSIPNFFQLPPPLTLLENGQKVVVTNVEGGTFYLRTKECFQKLKEIDKKIEEFVKSAELMESVKIGQLVLAPDTFEDKYYRAIVTSVRGNEAEVRYLDHCIKTTVNFKSLKNINKLLSVEPVTYLRGKSLKGFENDNFSEDDHTLIKTIIETRKKFVVMLDEEDNFDLFDGSRYLSEQLGQQEKSIKRIKLEELDTYKPRLGIKTYLCGYYKHKDEFALVPVQELEENIHSVLISKMEDLEPYIPVIGEVCFCCYMDEWYRCLVTKILKDKFEVVLLDFGNVELVTEKNLRKAGDQMPKVPLLALQCKLINLPDHPNVEDLLKKLVIEGELFNVDLKGINDGKYEVEIPSVYQQIMESPV